MITDEQYRGLKVGDVLMFRGRPRTIREVTPRCVTLSILIRSWTGRGYTIYTKNEVMRLCDMPPAADLREAACQSDLSALLRSGFDAARELEREIAEQERLDRIWKDHKWPERDGRRGLVFARAALRRLKRETKSKTV